MVTSLFQKGTQASTEWLNNLLTDNTAGVKQLLLKPNKLVSESVLVRSHFYCVVSVHEHCSCTPRTSTIMEKEQFPFISDSDVKFERTRLFHEEIKSKTEIHHLCHYLTYTSWATYLTYQAGTKKDYINLDTSKAKVTSELVEDPPLVVSQQSALFLNSCM